MAMLNVTDRTAKEMYLILSLVSNAKDLRTDPLGLGHNALALTVKVQRDLVNEAKRDRPWQIVGLVDQITPAGYQYWGAYKFFFFAVAFTKKVVNGPWKGMELSKFTSYQTLLHELYNHPIPDEDEASFNRMADQAHKEVLKFGLFNR